jgi:hypothetical protein
VLWDRFKDMSGVMAGFAGRRVVLRDTRNDRDTKFEAAQIQDDGTLRVTGHHTGPGVTTYRQRKFSLASCANGAGPERRHARTVPTGPTPADRWYGLAPQTYDSASLASSSEPKDVRPSASWPATPEPDD